MLQDPLMVKPPDHHMARAMNQASSARVMSSSKPVGEGSSACRDSTSQEGHGAAAASTQVLKCPRCDSMNTKFCYYNNYSLTQPRHFCKNCRRYWTQGGTLRNVPVGGGCRKNKARVSAKLLLHHGQHEAPPQPPLPPSSFLMPDLNPPHQHQHAFASLHGFGAEHLHGNTEPQRLDAPPADHSILRMAFSRLQESLRAGDQASSSCMLSPCATTYVPASGVEAHAIAPPQQLLSLDPVIAYGGSLPHASPFSNSCMDPAAPDLIYMDQLYAACRPVDNLSSSATAALASIQDQLSGYGSSCSAMHTMMSSAEHQRQHHDLQSGAPSHHGSDQQLEEDAAAAASARAHIEDWGAAYNNAWRHPANGSSDSLEAAAAAQVHGSTAPTNLSLHFWNQNSAGWAADLHQPLSAHAGSILN